jgi:invasion protein IalB
MYARYSVSAFMLAVAGLAGSAASAQQAVTKLGDYKSWTAYVAGADAGRVCYIVGQALGEGSDGGANRYAYVAHRPAKKAWSVVMVYPGKPYRDASPARIDIGKNHFSLFTYKDTAWTADAQTDARLVKAMRTGKTMTVHGVDADGGTIADHYSLAGFIAAYRRIGEACGAK